MKDQDKGNPGISFGLAEEEVEKDAVQGVEDTVVQVIHQRVDAADGIVEHVGEVVQGSVVSQGEAAEGGAEVVQ